MTDYTLADFTAAGYKAGQFYLYQNERAQGLDVIPGTLLGNEHVPLYSRPGSTEWNSLARTMMITGHADAIAAEASPPSAAGATSTSRPWLVPAAIAAAFLLLKRR